MQRNIIIGMTIALLLIAVLALMAWNQRNQALSQANLAATAQAQLTAQQNEAKTIQATLVAEAEASRATATVEAQAWATAQTEAEKAQATAVAKAEMAQAEVEAQHQLAQAQQLAAQSSQMLDETYEELVRRVLLATESMRRLPTLEGNIALRGGLALLPRPILQLEHEDYVTAVDFSPDGQLLATGSGDGTVRIWDVATGREIIQLGHEDWVTSVVFSPDGNWLATGSNDKTGRIWDVTTGQEVLQVTHEGVVWSVAFRPDGQQLATGSGDGMARIWDIVTGYKLNQFTHKYPVVSVAFTNDGRWLATKSSSTLQIWDIATGVIVNNPEEKITGFDEDHQLATSIRRVISTAHEDGHVSTSFSPDGQWLATGSWDKTARIWQIEPIPEQLLVGHNDAVKEIIFSPDNQRLATMGKDNTARLWDTTNSKEMARITHQGPINSLSFSPDSQWLATASSDNTAQVLDVTASNKPMLLKHDGPVNYITFSSDSRWIATASGDGTARIWEVKTGNEMFRLEHGTFIGYDQVEHAWPINDVDFSPDSKQLVSGSDDSTARIWDVATGKEISRFEHEPFRYNDEITFTWQIKDVAFSTNGKWLVAQSVFPSTAETFFEARVWDIATRQKVITHSWFVILNPDGTKAALHSYGDIQISPLPPSEKIVQLSHPRSRQNVVFSPDGKLLASGSWNPRYEEGDIYIWDVVTGQEITYIPLETFQLAFSPNNQWLAAFTAKGFRVWDTMTGREVISTNGTEMAFSPDDRWLAVSSSNGNVHLLKLHPDDLIADACSRLPRNLTRQEWRQYLGDEPYRPTCPNLPEPEEYPHLKIPRH